MKAVRLGLWAGGPFPLALQVFLGFGVASLRLE